MKKHYNWRYLFLFTGVFFTTASWAGEKVKNAGNPDYPRYHEMGIANGTLSAGEDTNATIMQTIVSGTVTDETGEGLPGVTIRLKGSTIGTITGLDGDFRLEIPANQENGTLVFSFVGYLSEEIAVNNQSKINVQLMPDIKSLDEIVVIGYGTQKKSDLTGSVSSVTSKDFNPGQVTTPEQLISGKVAGVNITSNGGAPGSGSRIRIRGGSSLNANNDPLIVLDGVPLDNSKVAGAANPLNFLNPNDIESFNVLKDASATAIYGSRASNGVIIINTKKGKAGQELNVNLNSVTSVATPVNRVDVLNGDQFRELVNQQATDSQKELAGTENTDWQDLIFRNAMSYDNNLSISGAYKSLPYRLSVGHLSQEGILLTSHLKRTSASLNLNPVFLDDHLKVNLNVKGVVTNSRFADEGAIGAALRFDPSQPVYQEGNKFGGYYEWTTGETPNTLATRNPLSMLEQRDNNGEVKRSVGNLQLDYKFHFLPDLHANLNLGYDVTEGEGVDFAPATAAVYFNQGGNRAPYAQSKTNKLLDFYLNYTKELNGLDSKVDVTGGYSYQDFVTDDPAFPAVNLEGDTISFKNPARNNLRLISYFGRLNYTFKERYLFTATVRTDGSSRFSPETRWGTFPALAFAWRINEESFLQHNNIFSDLKLRAGYGITGQQDIGEAGGNVYFPYLSIYSFSDETAMYQFGNDFYRTLRPAGYDVNIKWEETATTNVGLDFGFMSNRITGTVEYYHKKTKDLLARVPVAAGSNLTNELVTNVGNMENQGIEAVLNVFAVDNDQVRWEIGINGTFNKSEVTSLSRFEDKNAIGQQVGDISGGTGNKVQIHTVGYAPYSFYLYQQVYDQNGSPVEGLYVDRNGDGQINPNDLRRYKSPDPQVYFGFNSQLTYNRWSAGFVLRGSLDNYMYNNLKSDLGTYRNISFDNYLTNMHSDILESGFGNNQFFSDYYVENASFLRMENLNLGYDFGTLTNVGNEKIYLRLSATVQNVFTITNYSGLDPEIAGGIDNNFYPRPRTYALGVNIGF